MVKSFKKKLLIGAVAAMMSCSFAYGAEAASRAEISQIAVNQMGSNFKHWNPQGKENLTGYSYEPWHFRYVGQETAKKISAAGLVMEEYMEKGADYHE